jgi:hypothetical protein
MKALLFATLASFLCFVSTSLAGGRTEKVTITATDPARGLLTVTGDGFHETIDVHMADIRFRQPSGRTTKRTLADIRPGMTGSVTAYWSVGTLATKVIIQTK